MKANNLSICVANRGCDKHCPYCVSKCTGGVVHNTELMSRNLEKVLTLARLSQVSSVMITGKGEPCLNYDGVVGFIRKFSEFPVELQTNGIWLSEEVEKGTDRLQVLSSAGLNIVAVSVDQGNKNLEPLVNAIHKEGMLCRVTFNVTNGKNLFHTSFESFFNFFIYQGIDQFTVRNIVAPNNVEENEQVKWIHENVDPLLYPSITSDMEKMCRDKGHHLRSLPYGAEVYDLYGVAVSFSDYCIQDDNNTEDIRSLIFQEDGHVYTSWNSKASILF